MKIHGNTLDLHSINIPAKLREALVPFADDDFEGYLGAEEVDVLLSLTGYTRYQLMKELIPLAQLYAVPPISNFKVGAVGSGSSGAIYFGANLEFTNEALSFSVHAEQAVIANAIDHAETGIQSLAISAAPCGYCRQFLFETRSAHELAILAPDETTLNALLPSPFGPGDLGITNRLMDAQDHNLSLQDPTDDAVVNAALYAANVSYAPYTSNYSGVAIKTFDGTISYGSYSENAAYNPSMSPLQAAFVLLVMRGYTYADISRTVLVEVQNGKCSQYNVTAGVLAAVSKVPLELYVAV